MWRLITSIFCLIVACTSARAADQVWPFMTLNGQIQNKKLVDQGDGTVAERTAPAGQCTDSVTYNASTNGATQLVALVADKFIRVCGYVFFVGATATGVSLVHGTGANCATDQVQLTPVYPLPAAAGIVDHTPVWSGLSVPAGKALCIKTGAGNPVVGLVYYYQQP